MTDETIDNEEDAERLVRLDRIATMMMTLSDREKAIYALVTISNELEDLEKLQTFVSALFILDVTPAEMDKVARMGIFVGTGLKIGDLG